MRSFSSANSKTIVYFVTEDWYFCSHRLPLAVAARDAGYAVYVVTRVKSHGAEIEAAGLNLVPIALSRSSKNPIAEAILIGRLIRIYKNIRPDIVHNVAMKPVIYGSIAAILAGRPVQVNALAGLGFLFSSEKITARVFRPIVKAALRMLLKNDRTTLILQNPDDVEVMVGSGTVNRSRIRLIMGSGVDTEEFRPQPEPTGSPIVLLAARLLWDKGVGEFVKAAKLLKSEGVESRFVLVGEGDDANPESISDRQLEIWERKGSVELWGRRSDMPSVLLQSHIVCLPSYREGLPKVLVEAASCGRPIVTTDAPGCREIVRDGVSGILVPVKDVESLARAIQKLLNSPETRSQMGQAGRQLVIEEFALEKVISETLDVYRSVRQ